MDPVRREKMKKSEAPNIRKVILRALNQEAAPIAVSSETREEIADLCIDEAHSKNPDKFRKEMDKIVSEIVQNHIMKGGKK